MQKWQCRWSPTLGELESTHQEVWGTDDYTDQERPTVFFGIYGLPDFYTLWRHKGERHVLWAGTDIIHFQNGYWLEDGGGIGVDNKGMAEWINKYCVNWCENMVEYKALKELGIEANICPSFLGNINDYEVSFMPGNKVYTSVSGDNFKQYGWNKIPELAADNPDMEFHLYGNTVLPFATSLNNIVIHGRVPKEQMNLEIKQMQGALRLTEFDGFSEILGKSILWGQYPFSIIEYPYMDKIRHLGTLKYQHHPNTLGRDYYRKILNQYPWLTK